MKVNTTHTRRKLFEKARELGYDWVDKAIANSEAENSMNRHPIEAKIHSALYGGFVFFLTPEGDEYWGDIAEDLESKNI